MKGKIIIILSMFFISLVQKTTISGAYFTDSVTVETTVSAGSWETLPSPALEFSLRNDKKAVSFTVSNINAFEKINYEIIYDSVGGDKSIAGSVNLTGENTFSRNNLILGSCSEVEGKVCVYDEGITKLKLKVTLFSSGNQSVLEKEISYN